MRGRVPHCYTCPTVKNGPPKKHIWVLWVLHANNVQNPCQSFGVRVRAFLDAMKVGSLGVTDLPYVLPNNNQKRNQKRNPPFGNAF